MSMKQHFKMLTRRNKSQQSNLAATNVLQQDVSS